MSGNDSGLYTVILSLNSPVRIRVGALGMVNFEKGRYLYIGSAQKSLEKRIARHRRRTKPLRWHIDYLRRVSKWSGSVSFTGQTDECALAWNIKMAVKGSIACRGFGSSDCRCQGHLIYSDIGLEEIEAGMETLKPNLRILAVENFR